MIIINNFVLKEITTLYYYDESGNLSTNNDVAHSIAVLRGGD